MASPAALPELPRFQAAMHTEQGTQLSAQIRRLEHMLRDRVLSTPNAQRLVWVPGIGKLVAYTLLLEIDDIHRLPSVRYFHSYCRLVPGAQDSGGRTRHKSSRDGNRYLKIALHHAAVRAAQYFPEIRAEDQRLLTDTSSVPCLIGEPGAGSE
ncbi:MAG: transposase [Gemmatimonadaceae bacterium]